MGPTLVLAGPSIATSTMLICKFVVVTLTFKFEASLKLKQVGKLACTHRYPKLKPRCFSFLLLVFARWVVPYTLACNVPQAIRLSLHRA